MVPFYVVVGINTFCAVLNLASIGKASNKRRRSLVVMVNAASIATASWNWIAGGVLLALLLGAIVVASVRAYAEFEHHCANAAVRFNEEGASKDDLMAFAKSVRRSERSAKSFGPIEIAKGMEYVSSLGITFAEARHLLPVSMLLSVALTVSHDLAIQTLVQLARLFDTPLAGDQLTLLADKLVVAAQRGLPLSTAQRELASFRNTALQGHNRFNVDELLAAMMTLSRDGIADIGGALGDVYNTIDRLQRRYPALSDAVKDLAGLRARTASRIPASRRGGSDVTLCTMD